MEYNMEFMYHLDELRAERKFKKEDFCDGICTPRQYRRYLSGEVELPFKNLIHFCEKLDLSVYDFIFKTKSRDLKMSHQIFKMYVHIWKGRIQEFEQAFKEIDYDSIKSPMLKKVYHFCKLKYEFKKEKQQPIYYYEQLKKMVNLENGLIRKAYDFADIIVILDIFSIVNENQFKLCMPFLEELMDDRKWIYLSGDQRQLIPHLYDILAGYYVNFDKNPDRVIEICDTGIQYAINVGTFHSMANMYGRKTWAYREKEDMEKAKESALLQMTLFKACLDDNIYESLLKNYKETFQVNQFIIE